MESDEVHVKRGPSGRRRFRVIPSDIAVVEEEAEQAPFRAAPHLWFGWQLVFQGGGSAWTSTWVTPRTAFTRSSIALSAFRPGGGVALKASPWM